MTITRIILAVSLFIIAGIAAFFIYRFANDQTEKQRQEKGFATATRAAEVAKSRQETNNILTAISQVLAVNAVAEKDSNKAQRQTVVAAGIAKHVKNNQGRGLSPEVQHALLEVLGKATHIESTESQVFALSPPVISNKARWMITFKEGNKPYLWNLQSSTEKEPGVPLDVQQRTITDVVFSKDDKWLALIADRRRPILLHLSETSAPEATIPLLPHNNDINAISFSEDNHWFVTGGEENIVRIWDLNTLKKEAPQESRTDVQQVKDINGLVQKEGHARAITAVAIDAQSTWLSSGDRDGIVFLWNLKSESGPQAYPIELNDLFGEIRDLAFAYNGRAKWLTAVTRSDGKDRAHLWNMNADHLVDLACEQYTPSAQDIKEIAPNLTFDLKLCNT